MARGPAGERWLGALPELTQVLARDWDLTLGAVVEGGTQAVVVEATVRGKEPAILKLAPPDVDTSHRELSVLLAAEGRGYAKLLRHSLQHSALLLERLDSPLSGRGLPSSVQLELICQTLADAWREVAPSDRFLSGSDKAESLRHFIEEGRRGQPTAYPPHVIDLAHRFLQERQAAFDPLTAVLAHGDCHSQNTLGVPGETHKFKFIDPEGLFIERAYDLGILMREWTPDLLLGNALELGWNRCLRLSQLTGVEPTAIWQWGYIERVSTGLVLRQLGMEAEADLNLRVVLAWSEPRRL